MDNSGNFTSVDTYDSDFSVEEIEYQTRQHFEDMKRIMDKEVNICDSCHNEEYCINKDTTIDKNNCYESVYDANY